MTYTIPWDSYLIHTNVWTYPPDAVLGPSVVHIPIEEVFFFVIQTYITSLLYILINKPTLYIAHLYDDTLLPEDGFRPSRLRKRAGQIFFTCFTLASYYFSTLPSSRGTYLALICVWAGPVLLALWCLAYQPLLSLPRSKTWLPILLPTAYLWAVDTIALLRGTWCIESQTKVGIQLWHGLELEEALFFLVTNTLVVFGLTAFENAVAVIETLPSIFRSAPALPGPILLMRAVLLSPSKYDIGRVEGIRAALANLSAKSRSFYLASSVFSGRLRVHLILLYAFCRVGDDFVDNASSAQEAERWISHLTHFLEISYSDDYSAEALNRALAPFPPSIRSILSLLPTPLLPSEPLFSLLEGFRSDVRFSTRKNSDSDGLLAPAPIETASDLEIYASHVASTVAALFLHLVYRHDPIAENDRVPLVLTKTSARCIDAGKRMGLALQYINIARDISIDAEDGRCYLPSTWLREQNLTPDDVIQSLGEAEGVSVVRERLLDVAFAIYEETRGAVEDLPHYARAGIRVAVESYMEIGRVLLERIAAPKPMREPAASRRGNRATVPRLRRLLVGWRALRGPRLGRTIPTKHMKSG